MGVKALVVVTIGSVMDSPLSKAFRVFVFDICDIFFHC